MCHGLLGHWWDWEVQCNAQQAWTCSEYHPEKSANCDPCMSLGRVVCPFRIVILGLWYFVWGHRVHFAEKWGQHKSVAINVCPTLNAARQSSEVMILSDSFFMSRRAWMTSSRASSSEGAAFWNVGLVELWSLNEILTTKPSASKNRPSWCRHSWHLMCKILEVKVEGEGWAFWSGPSSVRLFSWVKRLASWGC